MGAGWAGVQAYYMLIFSSLSLIIGIILSKFFNYQTMSFGYFFASLIAIWYLLTQFKQKIGRLDLKTYQVVLTKTILAGFLAGAVVNFSDRLFYGLNSIFNFGLKSLTFVLIYFLFLTGLRFFEKEDEIILKRFLKIILPNND